MEINVMDLTEKQIVKELMINYGFTAHDMTVTEFVEDILPSAQPEPCEDAVSRKTAINAVVRESQVDGAYGYMDTKSIVDLLNDLPSVTPKPFHNIEMREVLAYIDGMPEDVWQEFTGCLECRGWSLERKTAKWCGSDFA